MVNVNSAKIIRNYTLNNRNYYIEIFLQINILRPIPLFKNALKYMEMV